MKKTLLAVWIGSLGLCSLAFGDSIVFNTATGDIGSTHTYTLDGVNIIATGFNGGDLFGKNDGGDENGVGLMNDPSGDHEIFFNPTGAPQDFVQLDLLNLLNAGFKNFQFQMGSSTGGEAWSVSACATSGVDCFTAPITGTDENLHSFTVDATHHFVDFSSTNGNMLLGSIAATSTVPEPSFYGALAIGMLVLAGMVIRRRSIASL
jgi:hypothetical protein